MSQSANKLLAALPRRDYQRLKPVLRTLHLSAEMGLLIAVRRAFTFLAPVSVRSSTRWPTGAASRSPDRQ